MDLDFFEIPTSARAGDRLNCPQQAMQEKIEFTWEWLPIIGNLHVLTSTS
jgi:hypothetical protein